MMSPRMIMTRAIATTAVGAMSAVIAVPPATANAAAHSSVTVQAHHLTVTESVAPLAFAFPTSIQQLAESIIPSLGAPVPNPPPIGPVVAPTNVNSAIKDVYNAVEPWVRYGFELATYAAGWVPYVGWLSGQIMIFYNFAERIARSVTFNVDDWLFGPLPFVAALTNVAQDSWNALVQLGIDQWNFWLPPLPPLPPFPLAADEAAADDGSPALRVMSVADTPGDDTATLTGTDVEGVVPVADGSADGESSPQPDPAPAPPPEQESPGDDGTGVDGTDEDEAAADDGVLADTDVDPEQVVDEPLEGDVDPEPDAPAGVDPSENDGESVGDDHPQIDPAPAADDNGPSEGDADAST